MNTLEKREAFLFLKKSVIFSGLFIAMIFSFPFTLMLLGGELTPLASIIKRNVAGVPLMVGLAYSNPIIYYHRQTILQKKPRVIFLGTSRVMSFRSDFFRDKQTAYIAIRGVNYPSDFLKFIESLGKDQQPVVLIVGLDQPFFLPTDQLADYGKTVSEYAKKLDKATSPSQIFLNNWKKAYVDFWNKKISLRAILHQNMMIKKFGFTAVIENSGNINDGSYYKGEAPSVLIAAHKNDTDLTNYQIQHAYYPYPIMTSSGTYSSLLELEKFLIACQRLGIHVIGFSPPFTPSIYKNLKDQSKDRGWIFLTPSILEKLFKDIGFTYFNFTDPASVGISDKEMLDATHTSEKAALRMFIDMAEKDMRLSAFVDIDYLKKNLEESKDDYRIFVNYQ